MRPLDLIATARRLLGKKRLGSPRQSDLKRAISTAYYAMFHALCWNCANCLIGKTKSSRSKHAWRQAYRAIEHGFAKNQCRSKSTLAKFPKEIEDFANQFAALQEKRHQADYDPFSRFTRNDVLTSIEAAETAIRKLQKSNVKDKRAFAAWTAMKNRAE